MNAQEIKYQIIKIVVPNANASVTVNANTNKLYSRVTGLLITMPFDVTPKDKSLCSIEINESEIFPEEFEIKLIVSDLSIPVNERMYKIEEQAEGSTVKIKYKDGGMQGVVYPYQANLYLQLEGKI